MKDSPLRRLTACAVLMLLAAAPAAAQPAEARLESGLPFLRNFGPRDYGGAGQNWTVVQDPRGVIYVGNNDGVMEFDGLHWRVIPTPGRTVVRGVAVDAGGRVHVGGVGEIGYLAPDETGRTRYVSLLERLPPEARDFADVWRAFATGDGVHFFTNKRVLRVKDGEVRVWNAGTLFRRPFFRVGERLFVREEGRGLLELASDELRLLPGGEMFAQERIDAVLPWPHAHAVGRDDALLVGTRGRGLFVFDGTGFQPLRTEADAELLRQLLNAAAWTADGALALGTIEGGVHLLSPDGRRLGRLDRSSGLLDENVNGLFADSEGGLWIALNRGLARVEVGAPLSRFDERSGLLGGVLALARHQGRLHVGTDAGVLRLEPGAPPRFQRIRGIQGQTWGLLSRGEDLLAANAEGLYAVHGDEAVLVQKYRAAFSVLASAATPDLAFVGLKDGLALLRRDGGRWREDGRVPGVSDEVHSLAQTAHGVLWAATWTNGVLRLRFDGGPGGSARVERFGTAQGLPSASENTVCLVGAEPLFATRRGVYRFDEARATFQADPRFAGLWPEGPRALSQLAGDAQGRLWMASTGRGAKEAGAAVPSAGGTYRWDPSALQALAGSDVVQILREDDGVVWLGGEDGLFRFDARLARDDDRPFRALVREARRAEGDPVFGGSGDIRPPELPFDPGALRFEYAAPSFDGTDALRFQVWLEGNDQAWSAWRREGFTEYTNLREGAYRLRVRARNLYGRVSEEGSFAFRVLPPWYRTVPARLAWAALAAALGWAVLRWRLRRVEAEKRVLEERVAERTARLAEANEDLRQAQEQLARLAELDPDKVEDVAGWGTSMAAEIARAIHARSVEVFRFQDGKLVELSHGAGPPPDWPEVQAAVRQSFVPIAGVTVVPVNGMAGELRGALVVDGVPAWGETERRLVAGLAQHLGSALDLQALRTQLAAAASRQAEMRQRMLAAGVSAVKVCRRCGQCYPNEAEECAKDGGELDGSRLLPWRVHDRYQLTRLLGEGGMGSVFAAYDESLRREVALKVIRPQHLADEGIRVRLQREARVLVRVQHPSIITLFDTGELEDGSTYLVMELLAGRDLACVLLASGRGSRRQVARLLRQVGAALAAAHAAGIVHRDVKPANILLQPEDGGSFRSRVLDFGLARSTRHDTRLTRTGMLLGTPAYMAPEQVNGGVVDGRTDLYALAAVAYEALSGRPVVETAELGRMLLAVMSGAPPPPSSLVGTPPEVDQAFAAALAKESSARPHAVEAWAFDLAEKLEASEGADVEGWRLEPPPATPPSPVSC